MTATLEKQQKKTRKRRTIPKELVYELINGSPVYYRDYEKVLSGETTLEGVMGSSDLQSVIVSLILKWLYMNLDDKYLPITNEAGYVPKPKTRYNLDIAILNKGKIKKLTGKYLKEAPEIVIEIDTKADLRKFENPQNYFIKKTQDLLDSGVKKVIWVFTKEKKVWIAEKNKDWIISNWNKDIKILDNLKLNIENLLEKEGIKY